VRVDELCRVTHGGTPSKDNPSFWVGNIPWVSPKDMRSGVIKGTQDHISEEAVEASATNLASPGTILVVARSGILARAAPVAVTSVRVAFNQDIKAIEPDPAKTDVWFLYWTLKACEPMILASGVKKGATVHSIRSGFLESLEIPLPPMDEQRRIATVLGEQMAAVARERAAAEAQLEAAASVSAAYLRKVFDSAEAQTWERKRIRDIAECCSGATPARHSPEYFEGTVPWVKTGELRDDLIESTEEYVTEAALRETSLRLLPAGTLLVAMYGQRQTRGRTGLLAEPATTNQACFAILPNPSEFDPAYLQLWFRYSYLRIRGQSEGRGGNQPNLNGVLLGSEEVPLPTIEQQRRVMDGLKTAIGGGELLRKAVSQEIEVIGALPEVLLRRAFSGEL